MLADASQGLPFRAGLFQPFLDDVEKARTLEALSPAEFARSPIGARIEAMLVQRDGHWLGLGTIIGMQDPAAFDALARETDGPVRLLDLKGASVPVARTSASCAPSVSPSCCWCDRLWHFATSVVPARARADARDDPRARRAARGWTSLSLFHLVALTLAAGLGLHYALFFERSTPDAAEARRTLHATLVCVISALLVFALLAWSSLPVLRAIGLTVSLGVGFHFCLSILMARKGRSRDAG
jgi:predicted exporter